jgi:hypothetical protein
MYSPKIKERFIPTLYRLAKARQVPMTRLVNQFVQEGIVRELAKDPMKRKPRNEDHNQGGKTKGKKVA